MPGINALGWIIEVISLVYCKWRRMEWLNSCVTGSASWSANAFNSASIVLSGTHASTSVFSWNFGAALVQECGRVLYFRGTLALR